MLVYYVLAGLVLVAAVPLCVWRPCRGKTIAYLCLVFGFMFLLSVLREGIGNDFYRYEEMFALARQPWQSVEVTADIGFEMLLRLFALLHMGDRVIFAVLALGCLAPVAWFIYKNSPCVWLSCWLYLTLTFFYGTLNFVRQNLALSVLLLAFPLLKKGTWKAHGLYLLVVAATYFVHTSVIIMVPVLLVLHIPLRRWSVALLAALDIVCVVFSQQLLNFFALRADGEYYFLQYHVDNFYLVGLSPKFLILPTAFAVLLLVFVRPLRTKYADADFYIKMALVSACIWSFVTRFFILERFSLFTHIYIILALPMLVRALQNPPREATLSTEQPLPAEEFLPTAEEVPAFAININNELPLVDDTQQPIGKMSLPIGDAPIAEDDDTPLSTADEEAETETEPQCSAHRQALRVWGVRALVAAVLCATMVYNVFGMTDAGKGFHGDFPYRSCVEFLNDLP